MDISPDLSRAYLGRRPSLRTPTGALVLRICLAVLIVGSGLSATSASAATTSASTARKWSVAPTITRSSNATTTFPAFISATYNGYEDSFDGYDGGYGADITAVFTPPDGIDPCNDSDLCDYLMSGISGTLFGNTTTFGSPGVQCSVTITPTIEQYLVRQLGATIVLSTEFGGNSGTGSGGSFGWDIGALSVGTPLRTLPLQRGGRDR